MIEREFKKEPEVSFMWDWINNGIERERQENKTTKVHQFIKCDICDRPQDVDDWWVYNGVCHRCTHKQYEWDGDTPYNLKLVKIEAHKPTTTK